MTPGPTVAKVALNMFPVTPMKDAVYSRFADAIKSGQSKRASSWWVLPDLQHLRFSELGSPVTLTCQDGIPEAGIKGVLHVSPRCQIFQVAQRVAGLVPVFVIDLVPIWAWAEKCASDELVNRHSLRGFSGAVKANGEIAPLCVHAARQDALLSALPNEIAAHSALVGDAVPALVTNDWTPFFGEVILGLHRKLTPFGAMRGAVTRSALASILPGERP